MAVGMEEDEGRDEEEGEGGGEGSAAISQACEKEGGHNKLLMGSRICPCKRLSEICKLSMTMRSGHGSSQPVG